jgi:putative transposase
MDAAKVIRKSFKFRIYPTKAQTVKLAQTLELCRELYNAGLQERRDAWKLNKVSINYFDQQNQLPEIKSIRDDLSSIHSQILQDVLKRVDKTFKAFFNRIERKEKAGFPRFKGRNRFDSFCFPQSGFTLTGNKLSLSKIGKVKIKFSREITGKVKTLTVKSECGKWFVIFSVETATAPLPKTNKEIGLDAGIESFITLSDGTKIENFKYFESTEKKLRVAQRKAARRKIGSNRRRKAVLLLKKIYAKIKNQRNDFQHKVSTRLVKDFDLIAIEKLNILGMSRSILAKQVNDAAWHSFFQKLKYKAENAGKSVIEVNPNFTSQDCSACGDRVKKRLSERSHHCPKCGLKIHRDENAALNILKLGQSFLAQTKAVRL